MKAAVLKGIRDIRCEDIPDPRPGPGEVIVKVRFCGICGSDMHGYGHGLFSPGTVMGHEFSGEIVELGDGVEALAVGARVTANPANPCGSCRWCRKGELSRCPSATSEGVGMSEWPGALAEYVRVRAAQVRILPENVSLQEGALTEPAAVALHAVRSSGLGLTQTSLVTGAGTVGLLVMQLARLASTAKVAVVEPARKRRKAAVSLGFEAVYDPRSDDLGDIKKVTGGGPEMVFECSGAPQALNDALRLVVRGGKLVLVGMSLEPVTISHVHVLQKELTLQASLCYWDEFDHVLPLVSSGALRVDSLATHVVPLDEIEKVFAEVTRAENAIKVLVEP